MPTKKEKDRIIQTRTNNFCNSEYFEMIIKYVLQKEPVAYSLALALHKEGVIDIHDFLDVFYETVTNDVSDFLKCNLSVKNNDKEVFSNEY